MGLSKGGSSASTQPREGRGPGKVGASAGTAGLLCAGFGLGHGAFPAGLSPTGPLDRSGLGAAGQCRETFTL